MKKRLLALLLIVCLVVAIPCQASAATISSKLATPKVEASSNSPSGEPTVKWNAIAGASDYELWYKLSGTSGWNWIGTTKKTSYCHSGAVAGKKYEYAVRAYKGDMCSKIGYSNVYMYTSTTITVSNHVSRGKPELTWTPIAGASDYQVWYRVNSGSWNLIGSTKMTTYYDKDAVVGNTYEYAVRAYNAGVRCSAFDYSNKITCLYETPKVKLSKDSSGKLVVKWDPVPGATTYQLWYSEGHNIWKQTPPTKRTSYIHFDSQDLLWRFAVKVYNGVGSEYGYINQPPVIRVNEWSGKPGIAYGVMERGDKYHFWYRENGGSWTYLTEKRYSDTEHYAFEHEDAVVGRNYEYRYRIEYFNGSMSEYGYSQKFTCLYPVPKSKDYYYHPATGKPCLKWNSVAGATMYEVQYSENGGKWKSLGPIQSTKYIHSGAKIGCEYKYRVRVYNGVGSEFFYYEKAKCKYPAPKCEIYYLDPATGKPCLKWNSVAGATMYEVQYSENGGKWKSLGPIQSTKYIHSGAKIGCEYKFRVRVYNGVGSEFHYYGEAMCKYPAPKCEIYYSDSATGKICLKWNSVAGATMYEVQYSENGGKWKSLGPIQSTKYIHSGAKIGCEYKYRVRVYNGVGSSYGDSSKFYYCFPKPENIGVIQTPTTLTVYWDPVPGATGYYVYADHNGNGIYQYRGYTTKTSYTQERMAAYNYVDVACSFRITVADGEISNYSGYSKTINQLDPPYIPKY